MSPIKSPLFLVVLLIVAVSAKPKFPSSKLRGGNVKAECGEILTGTGGTILSPNYPEDYDLDELCEWSLTSANGLRIAIVARDFDIEFTYDRLDIHDGPDDLSPLLATLTGQGRNVAVLTTGSQGYLRFYSDTSITAPGFNVTWSEYAGTAN